jgi:glutamine synthetase adenylyltransferase
MMKGFDHLIRLGQLEISESERQMARSLLPPLLKWLLAAKNEYQNVVVYRNLQQVVSMGTSFTNAKLTPMAIREP